MVGLFIDLHTVFLNICRTCGHRDREQDRFLVVVTMNSHSYAPEQYLHRNGIHMCSLQYIRAKLLHWNIGLCQSAILMDVSCPSMSFTVKGKTEVLWTKCLRPAEFRYTTASRIADRRFSASWDPLR
jgi:hypothetical protein